MARRTRTRMSWITEAASFGRGILRRRWGDSNMLTDSYAVDATLRLWIFRPPSSLAVEDPDYPAGDQPPDDDWEYHMSEWSPYTHILSFLVCCTRPRLRCIACGSGGVYGKAEEKSEEDWQRRWRDCAGIPTLPHAEMGTTSTALCERVFERLGLGSYGGDPVLLLLLLCSTWPSTGVSLGSHAYLLWLYHHR